MVSFSNLASGHFSIYELIALIFLIFTAALWILGWLRKRWKCLDNLLENSFNISKISDDAKLRLMILASIGSIFLLFYCWGCGGIKEGETYLGRLFGDMMAILPWFVLGCVMAGFMIKYLGTGRFRFPNSMLGAGAIASLLPICSCAAVPMARGLMLGKQIRLRTVITFLIIVPVLSPVVVILALARIGWEYLLLETVSVFALAITAGILIERFAGNRENAVQNEVHVSCQGCETCKIMSVNESALIAAWNQLAYLTKYIFIGIIIGTVLSVYVDASIISELFGTQGDLWGSIPGLVLIILIGIPLFICSGEDVVIMAPLLASGALPLGHAIAFAIAGNAICITSIPMMIAAFGKKVTAMLILSFFVGSFILGMIINGLAWVNFG